MSTSPTPAPLTQKAKIIGLLFTVGTAAASVFVKNPAHEETAQSIITILQALLPEIEHLI